MSIIKSKKSCETCKFREFEEYGWYCNKHNKWFDETYECYEIDIEICKYHKRDTSYCLSNGIHKWREINNKCYYYKKGKFKEYRNEFYFEF